MQNYRIATAVNGGGEAVTVQNGAGQVEVFTTGSDSTVWNFYPDPTSDTGYSGVSTALQAGTVAAGVDFNTPVKVSTNEQAEVTINGAVYFIDSAKSASVSTNGAGIISFAQQTSTLGLPTLQVNVPSIMQPGQTIAVDQSAGTQETFSTVTGATLMTATVADGSYLIPTQYRTTEETDALASAFNQCMNFDAAPAGSSELSTRRGSGRGVWLCNHTPATSLGRIRPRQQGSWRLSFEGGTVRYQTLTDAEAAALLAEKRASFASSGFFDWLDDVGDFLSGVVDDVIDIVDAVVTTVVDGIQAAFTFIIDGVTYLFETIITVVEEAFDVIESIFAQIGVIFEKIFEWLGFIFNWNDMLRTHEAISYTLNQFLTFLPGAIGGIQTMVDAGINNLQAQVQQVFNWAIQNIAGQSTIGGYEQENEESSPEFSSSVSNNIVYNGVVDNTSSASSSGYTLPPATQTAIDSFITQVTQFVDLEESSQAFQQAITYFTNLGGSVDQIFSQLLAGLMSLAEAAIEAVLSGVQAIADALLQLVAAMVSAIQGLLNEPWDIPFVSQFYSWITNGSTLTTIDLLSLIAAVPVTIIYKISYSAAPFPDEASVTAFEASFNAQTMLAASGLGGSSQSEVAQAQDSGGIVSQNTGVILGIFGTVATFFYACFTAILDAIPKEAPGVLSTCTFVAEAIAQAAAFPWFTMSGAPDCTTANGTAMWLWIYQCLGIALDLGFLMAEGFMPENWNDAGVWIAFVYGVLHLIVAIIASIPATAATIVADILYCIPELCKVLRLQAVIAATESFSLGAIAVIDGLFFTASAISGFIAVTQSSSDSAPGAPLLVTA